MNYQEQYSDWDKELSLLGGHFLQSMAWAEFQQAVGRESYRDKGKGWMWQATLREAKGIRYLLCSYGPVTNSKSAFDQAVLSLLGAGKALGCDFVRLEPTGHATATEMHKYEALSIAEVQPQHTQVINLTKGDEELRAELSSSQRNLINGTERRGIEIKQTTDPADTAIFLEMLKDTAKHSGVTFYPDWYNQKLLEVLVPRGSAKLYLATVEGQPVAMALFYDFNGVRYYAHAGAYQDLNRQSKASVSLVWQAVMDAKAEGVSEFDLWGVAPDDNPKNKWAGITRFKKSFGGTAKTYIGTWDIPLKKAKYIAYSLYRKLKGRE